MERNSKIDQHLNAYRNEWPAHVHQAFVTVVDRLDTAWIAAQSIFKDQATPDAAIAIFDRVQVEIDAQRQQYVQDVEAAATGVRSNSST